MLRRDSTARGVDHTGGDHKLGARDGAGARKVDGGEGGKVLCDGGGCAVGEEERDGAGEVRGEAVDAFCDGVGGGGAEGAGHEFGFAEKDSVLL